MKMRLWKVEATVHGTDEKNRNWSRNQRIFVIAETMEECMDLFREKYPDSVIHKIIGEQIINAVWMEQGLILSRKLTEGQ